VFIFSLFLFIFYCSITVSL